MLLKKIAPILLAAVIVLVWSRQTQAADFLWLVKNKNGNQVYLMGSVHLANPGLYPLSPVIEAAFANSHNLAVELNTLALDQEKTSALIAANGLYKNGQTLESNLSPETLALLRASPYYDPARADLKPWLTAVNINIEASAVMGYSPEYGLDVHFIREAQKLGRKIFEIETFSQQLSALWSMKPDVADLFLRSSLIEMQNLPAMMNTFISTWKNGDPDGFAEAFFQEYDKYPELLPVVEGVVYKRNEHMTRFVESMLRRRGEVTFIVVGAGHLVGPRGILAALKSKGYSVTQL